MLALITLKDVALQHPRIVTPYFQTVLGRLLPVMGMAVTSQARREQTQILNLEP